MNRKGLPRRSHVTFVKESWRGRPCPRGLSHQCRHLPDSVLLPLLVEPLLWIESCPTEDVLKSN